MQAEATQLLILLAVLAPLTILTMRNSHGLGPLLHSLPAADSHTWEHLPWYAPSAELDIASIVGGLGVALGITYWCGDFLLIQRLCAAREKDMLRTPELTILAKLGMPLLLVVPGLALTNRHILALAQSYDLSLPVLIQTNYGPLLATAALCALIASFFLSFCSQISAAAAIFMADIYPSLRQHSRSSSEALQIGRTTMLAFSFLAGVAANSALSSRSLMETIQLVLSLLNVPVVTVFLAGVLAPRVPRQAGSAGILAATIAGFVHWRLGARLGYTNGLSTAFHGALFSMLAGALTLLVITYLSPSHPLIEENMRDIQPLSDSRRYRWGISAFALLAMLLLYIHFK